MATFNDFQRQIHQQLLSFGKEGLNALYPRDFELYLVSLELVDSYGDTIDFFTFPIAPKSINKSELERTTIRKTLRATTIIQSDSFIPQDLSLSGNFGRNVKFLLPNIFGVPSSKAIAFSIKSGVYGSEDVNSKIPTKIPTFNSQVKTGYGCIKILQSIISKSKSHDNGKSFKLYFYNPALGESYLVAPTKNPLILNQTEQENMIWGYTLNLKIIADLSKIRIDRDLTKDNLKIIGSGVIQQDVSSLTNTVNKFIL